MYGKFRQTIVAVRFFSPSVPLSLTVVSCFDTKHRPGVFSDATRFTLDGLLIYLPPLSKTVKVTLHGGIIGWDRRYWTLERKSRTSVTYKHVDDGHENWPGTVTVFVTHTVENGGILKTVVKATATEKTPIMVTQHIYWWIAASL